MSAEAFYRLFLSTLEVHGFVALDSGGAIQIVPDAGARFGSGDDFVTQLIVLDNIGVNQLVALLAADLAAARAPGRAPSVELADRRRSAGQHARECSSSSGAWIKPARRRSRSSRSRTHPPTKSCACSVS